MTYHHTTPDDWPKRKPAAKHCLADMSEDMQTALIHCTSRGVSDDEFGDTDVHRWTPATRAALIKHGLIQLSRTRKGREAWKATDTGRGVVAAHVPRLLMPIGRSGRVPYVTLESGRQTINEEDRGLLDSGYTDDPRQSLRSEPEAA